MKKDFLADLLGSPTCAKLLRLFVFNHGEDFTADEAAKRIQVAKTSVKSELNSLEKTGLIKKKQCTREVLAGRGVKKTSKSKKIPGWTANNSHKYMSALITFLRNVSPAEKESIAGRFKDAGRVKLIVCAGRLCDDAERRVDLLVVGDSIDERKIQSIIGGIEADLGKEVRYAFFPTDEFRYRLTIYDKLVRDIFDYPHTIVLDKLGAELLIRS